MKMKDLKFARDERVGKKASPKRVVWRALVEKSLCLCSSSQVRHGRRASSLRLTASSWVQETRGEEPRDWTSQKRTGKRGGWAFSSVQPVRRDAYSWATRHISLMSRSHSILNSYKFVLNIAHELYIRHAPLGHPKVNKWDWLECLLDFRSLHRSPGGIEKDSRPCNPAPSRPLLGRVKSP